MSRYTFSYTVGGQCELYSESTEDEDVMDLITVEDSNGRDVGVCYCTEFTGSGYLEFWKRCKQMVIDSGMKGHGVILDTWYDIEKTI